MDKSHCKASRESSHSLSSSLKEMTWGLPFDQLGSQAPASCSELSKHHAQMPLFEEHRVTDRVSSQGNIRIYSKHVAFRCHIYSLVGLVSEEEKDALIYM